MTIICILLAEAAGFFTLRNLFPQVPGINLFYAATWASMFVGLWVIGLAVGA